MMCLPVISKSSMLILFSTLVEFLSPFLRIDVTPVASITNLDVFLKGCFVLLSIP